MIILQYIPLRPSHNCIVSIHFHNPAAGSIPRGPLDAANFHL